MPPTVAHKLLGLSVLRLDSNLRLFAACTRHAKKLKHFHTTYLRRLFYVRRQDMVPDTGFFYESVKRSSIYTLLHETCDTTEALLYNMPKQPD